MLITHRASYTELLTLLCFFLFFLRLDERSVPVGIYACMNVLSSRILC